MISYIPLPDGLGRAGVMLAKILSGEKYINIKPCGMYDWFDCHLPGCTSEKYSCIPPPPDYWSKCVFRSRSACFDINSISHLIRQANGTDSNQTDYNLMNDIFWGTAPNITVKLFNFMSDLFSWYSRGRYYHENKSLRKFNTSIIVNRTS